MPSNGSTLGALFIADGVGGAEFCAIAAIEPSLGACADGGLVLWRRGSIVARPFGDVARLSLVLWRRGSIVLSEPVRGRERGSRLPRLRGFL